MKPTIKSLEGKLAGIAIMAMMYSETKVGSDSKPYIHMQGFMGSVLDMKPGKDLLLPEMVKCADSINLKQLYCEGEHGRTLARVPKALRDPETGEEEYMSQLEEYMMNIEDGFFTQYEKLSPKDKTAAKDMIMDCLDRFSKQANQLGLDQEIIAHATETVIGNFEHGLSDNE